MGHKRPKSSSRVERDQMLRLKNKGARAVRWEKDRKKWASNEEYQDTQREREEVLRNKVGYKENILAGVKASRERKRVKEVQKRVRLSNRVYI